MAVPERNISQEMAYRRWRDAALNGSLDRQSQGRGGEGELPPNDARLWQIPQFAAWANQHGIAGAVPQQYTWQRLKLVPITDSSGYPDFMITSEPQRSIAAPGTSTRQDALNLLDQRLAGDGKECVQKLRRDLRVDIQRANGIWQHAYDIALVPVLIMYWDHIRSTTTDKRRLESETEEPVLHLRSTVIGIEDGLTEAENTFADRVVKHINESGRTVEFLFGTKQLFPTEQVTSFVAEHSKDVCKQIRLLIQRMKGEVYPKIELVQTMIQNAINYYNKKLESLPRDTFANRVNYNLRGGKKPLKAGPATDPIPNSSFQMLKKSDQGRWNAGGVEFSEFEDLGDQALDESEFDNGGDEGKVDQQVRGAKMFRVDTSVALDHDLKPRDRVRVLPGDRAKVNEIVVAKDIAAEFLDADVDVSHKPRYDAEHAKHRSREVRSTERSRSRSNKSKSRSKSHSRSKSSQSSLPMPPPMPSSSHSHSHSRSRSSSQSRENDNKD